MKEDIRFLKMCYGYPTWRAIASLVWGRMCRAVAEFVCKHTGHRIQAETTSPESGGECLYCSRCGWSLNIWHG